MKDSTKTIHNVKEKQYEITVSIRCLVFNHEPYLRQCLDGFVMQKTNFRFEAIVHDDVSTDGSVAIIREYAEKYPDIIKPIYETENQYSKKDGSLNRIMYEACRGKYIAICEGDDYWTDPLKLQKQVEFLEANPTYGLVLTDINRFYQSTGKIEQNFFSKQLPSVSITFYELLINAYWLAPCTWLYRTNLYEDIKMPDDCFKGDIAIALGILKQSKMFKMNESTACYRVLEQSASHFNDTEQADSFYLSVINTRCYFASSLNYLQKLKLLFKITKELRGRFVNRRRKRIDLFIQNTISVVKKIYEIH